MSMTELERRCVDVLAKAQGLEPHEIAALPISTATGNLLDEVRAVLAEAGVAELVGALRAIATYDKRHTSWSLTGRRSDSTASHLKCLASSALTKIGANQ